VPQEPGTMCARGALLSDVSLDFVRTQLAPATPENWAKACRALREMVAEGDAWLAAEKVDAPLRQFNLAIDAHYDGQNHEIRVALDEADENGLVDFLARFAKAHEAGYGYDIPGQGVVIVSCRLQAVGKVQKHIAPSHAGGTSVAAAKIGTRDVYYGPQDGWQPTRIYRRAALPTAEAVAGPAIIDEMSSTTVVLKGQSAVVDAFGNIVITQ
jgi:N-methylhydantoinase A